MVFLCIYSLPLQRWKLLDFGERVSLRPRIQDYRLTSPTGLGNLTSDYASDSQFCYQTQVFQCGSGEESETESTDEANNDETNKHCQRHNGPRVLPH